MVVNASAIVTGKKDIHMTMTLVIRAIKTTIDATSTRTAWDPATTAENKVMSKWMLMWMTLNLDVFDRKSKNQCMFETVVSHHFGKRAE